MTKFKNWRIVTICSLLFALMLTLSFGFATIYRVKAAENEVVPEITFYENFDKGTATVKGEEIQTYSMVGKGWGGWANVFKFNSLNLSELHDTGKGAFSFWLYVDTETTRAAYAAAPQWLLDVSSNANYSDGEKYCYQLADVIHGVQIGWNRIVVPCEPSSADKTLDWSNVQSMRFNLTAGNFGAWQNEIQLGGFKFITDENQTMHIAEHWVEGSEEPLPSVDDVTVTGHGTKNFVGADSVAPTTMTVAEKEIQVYDLSGKGWGSWALAFLLDSADGSKLYETNDGAFSFWLDITDAATLDAYKAVRHWDFEISFDPDYSDNDKYTYSLPSVLHDVQLGWNRIVVPFNAGTPSASGTHDWSKIQSIRINIGGGGSAASGISNGQNEIMVGGFLLTLAEQKSPYIAEHWVEGGQVTPPVEADDVAFTVTSAHEDARNFDLTAEMIEINGEKFTAYNALEKNVGPWVGMFKFAQADGSAIAATGRGALTFWMYFADEATLNAYKAVKHWNADLCYVANFSDNAKSTFALHASGVFAQAKLGWNKIVLPLATANAESGYGECGGAPRYETTLCLRLNMGGGQAPLAGIDAGQNQIKIGGFGYTTTDQTNHYVAEYFEGTGLPELPPAPSFDDVEPTINSYDDFTVYTKTVAGEEITAYGALGFGWGGWAKVFKFDSLDLSELHNSKTGAFSFWLYIDNEATKAAYANAAGWLIDVSSDANYSDAVKYVYQLSNVIRGVEIGWNRIVVPFEPSSGETTLDWANVQSMRFNLTGAGFQGGQNEILIGGFKFVSDENQTVRIAERYVEGGEVTPPAPSFEDVEPTINSYDDFEKSTEVVDGEEITVYGALGKGWGGWFKIFKFDSLDLSELHASKTGAFSFWLYIDNEATRAAYANAAGWLIDVSSDADYSDAVKYVYQLSNVIHGVDVGWNRIVVPFEPSNGETTLDWANVQSMRFNLTGAGFQGGQNEILIGGFKFVSDEDQTMRIADFIKKGGDEPVDPPVDADDVAINVNGAHEDAANVDFAEEAIEINGERFTAYNALSYNLGPWVGKFYFAQADGSAVAATNRGAFTFWIYFADEATLNAYKTTLKHWNIDLSFVATYSDNAKSTFALHAPNVFAQAQLGWNKVVVPLATANVESNYSECGGSPRYSTTLSLRINMGGGQAPLAGIGSGENQIKIGGFGYTTTDETSSHISEYFEGSGLVEDKPEPPVDLPDLGEIAWTITSSHEDHNNKNFVTEQVTINGKTFTAYGLVGQQLDPWVGMFTITPVDASAYVAAGAGGAFSFWIYIADEATLKAYQTTLKHWQIDLSSLGTYADSNKAGFQVFAALKNVSIGWQKVVVPLSSFLVNDSFDMNWATLSSFRLNIGGGVPANAGLNAGENEIKVGGFALTQTTEKSAYISEWAPIERSVLVNGDNVVGDWTVDYDEAKEGTGALVMSGANANLNASFSSLRTKLTLTGDNELGLVFWLYVDKASLVNTLTVTLRSESGELRWNISTASLKDGWNWIVLKAHDAENDNIDLDALTGIEIGVNGTEGSTLTVRLDYIAIVNLSMAGAENEVSDRRSLNPITEEVLDNAESAWTGASYDETIKKQGYGSVILSNDGQGTVSASKAIDVRNTDLLAVGPKPNNELGVTMWLYTENAGAVSSASFRLSSGSKDYIEWNLTGLVNGWNWVVLRASEASVTGNLDVDRLTGIRLTVAGNAFNVRVDRVHLVNVTVASAIAQPADESWTRSELQELVILDCNSAGVDTPWPNNDLDTANYRYGNGSIIIPTRDSSKIFQSKAVSAGRTDLTKDTLVLAFWLYVDNLAGLKNARGEYEGQVELTSSGKEDMNELSWSFASFAKDLKVGWNWVVLKASDGGYTGGELDYNNINFFRLYMLNTTAVNANIDRITIGSVNNAALFAEPDWESEMWGDDIFSGANGLSPSNGYYFDTDIEGEDYLGWEAVEYTEKVSGCASVLFASGPVGTLIAVIVLAGAAALIILPRRKKGDK